MQTSLHSVESRLWASFWNGSSDRHSGLFCQLHVPGNARLLGEAWHLESKRKVSWTNNCSADIVLFIFTYQKYRLHLCIFWYHIGQESVKIVEKCRAKLGNLEMTKVFNWKMLWTNSLPKNNNFTVWRLTPFRGVVLLPWFTQSFLSRHHPSPHHPLLSPQISFRTLFLLYWVVHLVNISSFLRLGR